MYMYVWERVGGGRGGGKGNGYLVRFIMDEVRIPNHKLEEVFFSSVLLLLYQQNFINARTSQRNTEYEMRQTWIVNCINKRNCFNYRCAK